MARYELNLRDYYRILRRHIIIIVVVAEIQKKDVIAPGEILQTFLCLRE